MPAVSEILVYIQEKACSEEVYLVGSATTGDWQEGSDLDFVIVVADGDIKDAKNRLFGKRPRLDIAVDFIIFPRSEFEKMKTLGGLAHEAIHRGILMSKGTRHVS